MTAPCPNFYIGFDVVETAKAYANIAAFLAGFAFAAIAVLLAAHIDGPGRRLWDDLGDALKVLLSAFVCLVVTAFEYAVQAGEIKINCNIGNVDTIRVPSRLATEEIITGIAFASGVFLLIFAVVLVLDAIDKTGWRAAPDSVTSGTTRLRAHGVPMSK